MPNPSEPSAAPGPMPLDDLLIPEGAVGMIIGKDGTRLAIVPIDMMVAERPTPIGLPSTPIDPSGGFVPR